MGKYTDYIMKTAQDLFQCQVQVVLPTWQQIL